MENRRIIRLGLVGIGRAGKGMHMGELMDVPDKFTYVAGCDIIPERLELIKERFPGCKGYTRIEDLIADPDVEIVDIATRSVDHYAHAKMALLAGKHVLIEKPMSCTYAQAAELKEISDSGKYGRLFVRHNRRFERGYEYVRKLIDSGILGFVHEIRLARNSFGRRNDWQTLNEFGGGMILNWGPHIVDHSLRLLDSPVKRMFSHLDCVTAAGDCEDAIKMIFEGENGRIIDMEINSGVACHVPEYVIYGTRGSAIIDGVTAKLRYVDPAQKFNRIEADPRTPGATSFGASGTFESAEEIRWIEEEVIAPPNKEITLPWDTLYDDLVNGIPYPISLDQALEVIKMIDDAKQIKHFRSVDKNEYQD